MRRVFSFFFVFILFFSFVFSQELVTGSKREFTPGDKVIFFEDFSKCPVGEPPMVFDKVMGAGECVRYGDQIWIAPATNDDYRVYKKLDIGKDEFSIEFDYLLYQDISGALGPNLIFRFLESRGQSWDKAKPPYDLEIVAFYNTSEFRLENVGRIGRTKNAHKKRIHVALQVRRGQLRVYVDGNRLTVVPFKLTNGEHISGFEFMFVGDTNKYGAFVSNIKVAKYTSKEKKPEPEKLGIKVEKTAKATKLTIPEKVLFDFNKFFLKPEAKDALNVIAKILKEKPHKKIIIIGYTDSVGSDAYNLKLSLQRAQSVADYLIYVEGIDSSRIKIEGKGKANPIADNSTEEGRAKNRRVEIKIIE